MSTDRHVSGSPRASLGLALLCAFGISEAALASAGSVRANTDRFIVRRDQCDHFRGEDAYDAARGRFLAAQMRKYCKGTDRELKRLRIKYAKNPAILARLAKYEDSIE
jgi:hypothetical protein